MGLVYFPVTLAAEAGVKLEKSKAKLEFLKAKVKLDRKVASTQVKMEPLVFAAPVSKAASSSSAVAKPPSPTSKAASSSAVAKKFPLQKVGSKGQGVFFSTPTPTPPQFK